MSEAQSRADKAKAVLTAPIRGWRNKFNPIIGRAPRDDADSGGELPVQSAPSASGEGSSSGTTREQRDARLLREREGAPPPREQGSPRRFATVDPDPGARQTAFNALSGASENIHRDKTLFGRKVGESKDKGYGKNVEDAVNAFMNEAIGKLVTADSADPETFEKAQVLREALVKERNGYAARKTGETDKSKLDQRAEKVVALDKRIAGLDTLVEQATVRGSPDAASAGLMSVGIDSVDGLVEKVLTVRGADQAYMEELFRVTLHEQVKREMASAAKVGRDGKNTFLRSNNPPMKLIAAQIKADPEAQQAKDAFQNSVKALVPPSAMPMEVDPSRIKASVAAARTGQGTPTTAAAISDDDVRDEIADGIAAVARLVQSTLRRTFAMKVPRAVSVAASMIAAEARANGLDRKGVALAVGSVVVLRFIGPALATMRTLMKEPKITEEQQRALTLASKAVQNLANGIAPDSAKTEPAMKPVMAVLQDQYDTMADWLLAVADEGSRVLEASDD